MELMLVTAMIGIITPAITFLFMKASQGMAADEMHTQLKKLNEQSMLRLHERLLSNKHMMQNTTFGNNFVGYIQLAAGTPPLLAGSRLARTQPSTVTSFSPITGAAIPASFGNSLFFAAYDNSQTFMGSNGPITSTAPLNLISIAGFPIAFSGANGPATVTLDVYRFFYYYLTPTNAKGLRDIPSYRLVEWQSKQYVDWQEINSFYISDNTLGQDIINWVTTAANFPGGPILTAYDSTVDDPTQAFITLTNGSYSGTPIGSPTITQASWSYITSVSSGILSSGFNYGVSSNSATWTSAPAAVPQFTTASGNFPGGFEVGMIGNAAGLEVLTRSLLVAQGAAPRIVWNDQVMTHNTRDVW